MSMSYDVCIKKSNCMLFLGMGLSARFPRKIGKTVDDLIIGLFDDYLKHQFSDPSIIFKSAQVLDYLVHYS